MNVNYDFRYGERFEYDIFPARDVERADSSPGIYAWFYRIPERGQNLKRYSSYRSLFAAKILRVSAKANLREEFEGRLKRTDIAPTHVAFDAPLAAAASAIFCPPLYIGISCDIRRRLSEHKEQLEENLSLSMSSPLIRNATPDSALESSQFGQRIGKWLRHHGVRDTRSLFVKVIYAPGRTFQELQEIESFYNRTYIPLFGRR